ncbi:type II toxin-antitoxin system VapC family toxin [Geminocystis sp. CENA526]|uniref:type II toxin-antitoxin system VapC family toxin n=1 Tax=Geminocystis sp. CENA526 TaxID=1355871 RepID=UPI003D6EBBAC
MNYLLDTHALIWFFSGDVKLSDKVRLLMENEEETKFISLVSIWEMGIKQSKGKLTLALPLEEYIEEKLTLKDYKLLPINLQQISTVTRLPFHHNDPFDRLLIAQSIVEKMPIISKDTAFTSYDIQIIWD